MTYQQYRPNSFNILPVAVKNLLIINGILWLANTVFVDQFGEIKKWKQNRSKAAQGLLFAILLKPEPNVVHWYCLA